MLKFKLFYDKDAEKVWLNTMSQKGWALKQFFLGFYSFKACEPNKYHYQIDLLPYWSGNKKDYAAFMKETGVEVISQWYRWVYIRKETKSGPFEMYTDTASKIAQYNRIKNFFKVGLIVESICLVIVLLETIFEGSEVYIYSDIALGVLLLVFFRVFLKTKLKVKHLKNELE